MNNETILKLSRVTKTYGKVAAVDDVNMTIKKGDIYGLIGKNGAGKTTLLRLVASLAFPDNGELELFGETTAAGLQEARARMGCVIEMPAMQSFSKGSFSLRHFFQSNHRYLLF